METQTRIHAAAKTMNTGETSFEKLLNDMRVAVERQGQCSGLRHALNLVKGRRILNRPPAYLAALDELEIFISAAMERLENGEEMSATCTVTTPI